MRLRWINRLLGADQSSSTGQWMGASTSPFIENPARHWKNYSRDFWLMRSDWQIHTAGQLGWYELYYTLGFTQKNSHFPRKGNTAFAIVYIENPNDRYTWPRWPDLYDCIDRWTMKLDEVMSPPVASRQAMVVWKCFSWRSHHRRPRISKGR